MMARRSLGPAFPWVCLLRALLAGSPVLGAGAPEPEKPLAIVGGDVYTITDGVIRGGTVLVEKGKIARVGASIDVPEGATAIDAKGKVVMPGLIAVRLNGLVPGGAKKVADALDPYSSVISFALASGVTAAFVQVGGPGDEPIGGSNAVVKMTEGDLPGMLLSEPVAIAVAYSNSQPRLKAVFRQNLTRAAEYLRKLSQYEKDKAAGKKTDEPKLPDGAEPMVKLLRRELPARISASGANDILAALQLVDDFGIRLILEGVVEGWTVPEEIAKRGVDVIISPREKQEFDHNVSAPTGSSDQQAAILKHAGVRFAITPVGEYFGPWGGFGQDLFTLPLEAAYAVGGGLDEQTALEAITITPARMLGVDDRVGSLQEGKDADIIVLDGHPLHYSTFVELTLVNGKVLYDKSKSTYFSHIRARPAPPEPSPPPK